MIRVKHLYSPHNKSKMSLEKKVLVAFIPYMGEVDRLNSFVHHLSGLNVKLELNWSSMLTG